jgi:hypothetical protein
MSTSSNITALTADFSPLHDLVNLFSKKLPFCKEWEITDSIGALRILPGAPEYI